jgi:hypothetical protein
LAPSKVTVPVLVMFPDAVPPVTIRNWALFVMAPATLPPLPISSVPALTVVPPV